MKYSIRAMLSFGSVLCFAYPSLSQVAASTSQTSPAPGIRTCSIRMETARDEVSGPVAPFSAIQESTEAQTLADGTQITQTDPPQKMFRDSQNRTRTERTACRVGKEGEGTITTIRDPVAGYAYILDPEKQIAHRYILSVRQATATIPVVSEMSETAIIRPSADGPEVGTENLGTQVMEGVQVEGKRTTGIIAAGAEGNDRAIRTVYEVWYSRELLLTILARNFDPRYGESTTRLTNVERTEPHPALFQPPLDYKIVDETEPVRITFTLK